MASRGRPKKHQTHVGGNRAVIYLRVSTEEQANPRHYGLAAQESDCRSYCEKMGYQVVGVTIDPGVSGTKTIEKRPGLLEALLLCERGGADILVVAKQDRLARKSGVFDAIRDRAALGKYKIEVAQDGQDVTSRSNRINAQVKSFVASVEAILIAERLFGGRKERSKKDGLGSGPVPFGYLKQDGKIIINRKALRPIQVLLQLREKETSYQATADELNRLKYKTPTGQKWKPSHVQTLERNKDLYQTGVRRWDGVEAEERWPIIYKPEENK